jgi:hypothetical protein
MFVNLLIGTILTVINLGVQVLAIAYLVRFFAQRIDTGALAPTYANDAKTLGVVMAVLMIGHAVMFATWALLFVWLGEFEDFATAYYHSTVNFTSLGYGDIVMTEQHRLLGALEAANGVLMFGLSAGAILSVMNGLFSRRKGIANLKDRIQAGE